MWSKMFKILRNINKTRSSTKKDQGFNHND